ncbi:hypothetical protein [Thalassotalea sp. PS06]|uniref:hypothetical protein n=1 Tax=Thalassotalea sp. PS06 TaxID=2594005 RepID=UPI001165194C|nr:hypothetical protein [Thalassotalea sp. PS06]QDP01041.1 hypothetical protein FNC98_06590 [Thalassotalea sp. PS06]
MTIDFEKVARDKHIFYLPNLPLFTIYDDNFFVRNDYDILSVGQRQYLIRFFTDQGFKQTSGKLMVKDDIQLHFPKPNRMLAQSAFSEGYLREDHHNYFFITPSTFAEVLFHLGLNESQEDYLNLVKQLINTCPINLELIRDINICNDLGPFINKSYKDLEHYQKQIIEQQYKKKKAL